MSIGAVHNRVKAYRKSGMAALQARNRNAAQNGKTASAPWRNRNAGDGNDDTEALRRRVEELELENALMREVVEVVKKRPRRRSELRPVCWTLLIGWIGYNELDSPMRDE